MLYIFSLLYIILKGLNFLLKNEILLHLTKNNLTFLFILTLTIIGCRKALKYKKIFVDLVDHLIQYKFKSKKDYYYSASVIFSTIVSYITIIIYLRIRAFNKPIDLNVIYASLQNLYLKMSKGILCYNLFIFILIIYLFIIFTRLLKKRLNIHITKMHFYLMSFPKYIRLHYYFRDHLSIDARLINPIQSYYNLILHSIVSLYLFGFYKKSTYRYREHANIPIKTKRYLWTSEEIQKYNRFQEKHERTLNTLNVIQRYIKVFFYHLSLIILIMLILLDIKYNEYILKNVALALPLLFLYQIYIYLSQFVADKIVYNVSAEINTMYYQDVTYISDKTMIVNNQMFERPNAEQIVKEFLEYEAVEFYWTRLNH